MTTRKRRDDSSIKAMVAAMLEALEAIDTIAGKHQVCPNCLAYKVADMLSDGELSGREYQETAETGTVQ